MRSSTGRWVSGDDFFDRQHELDVLEGRLREGNHLLVAGQRRMGKTSLLQEVGRRLRSEGWVFLFLDVEGADSPEDVIADLARALHPERSIARRIASSMKQWFDENVDELSAVEFGVKFRAALNAGSWQRHGKDLLRGCGALEEPVLLVIDELPIFLKRLLRQDGDARRVDGFLSWLRGSVQALGDAGPVLVVSGSIGLEPLVRSLGLVDRINHLYAMRVGPWDREASVGCFERLAADNGLDLEEGVADAVYDVLGVGIPHHVQSFFARLRDYAAMRGKRQVGVKDVGDVYRGELLGPSGQNDLVHYETRLREGLGDDEYRLAMEILAEAATVGLFAPASRRSLESLYSAVVDDAVRGIADALDVLVHDGYLETSAEGHRFASRLLADWWAARFRDHHVPLGDRGQDVLDRSAGE